MTPPNRAGRVSGFTHLGAALASAAGLAWLLSLSGFNSPRTLPLLVYGISLVLLFSASALYHLSPAPAGDATLLRKLDHSAIYLLIAGTYTPYCTHFFSGFWRWGLLAVIWSMALIGVGVKIFVIRAPRWVTAGIYLLMGWLSVAAVGEMLASMPAAALFWLLAGGIFYTLGALIYILKKPDPFPGVFGFHEVWHIFVILGAASHFLGVALHIASG